MAVNTSRDMRQELEQGIRDGKYMQLSPDWGVCANPSVEKLSWPTYQRVERHAECDCYEQITPREAGPSGGTYVVGKHGQARRVDIFDY